MTTGNTIGENYPIKNLFSDIWNEVYQYLKDEGATVFMYDQIDGRKVIPSAKEPVLNSAKKKLYEYHQDISRKNVLKNIFLLESMLPFI